MPHQPAIATQVSWLAIRRIREQTDSTNKSHPGQSHASARKAELRSARRKEHGASIAKIGLQQVMEEEDKRFQNAKKFMTGGTKPTTITAANPVMKAPSYSGRYYY